MAQLDLSQLATMVPVLPKPDAMDHAAFAVLSCCAGTFHMSLPI